MDEMLEMFNSFIGEAFDREKTMAAEFTEFEKKLNECVTLANDRGTPVQNKKRPKRQVSISEKDEEGPGSSITRKPSGAFKSGEDLQQKTRKHSSASDRSTNAPGRSSARMLDVTGKSQDDQAPQPMETCSAPNESMLRPSRTARLKAQEKLKEPSLNAKMRNDGGTTLNIKLERISNVANSTLLRAGKETGQTKQKATPNQTYVNMETENDANQANRIISPAAEKRNDEGFSSATEAQKQEQDKPSAAREMSLMVIPPVVPKVEILSDEEMPPPSMPPPKVPAPKVRTKKKAPVGGKGKKEANETASSSAVSSADSTMNSTGSTVSSSASETASTTDRPSRSKTKMLEKRSAVQTPALKELTVMIEPMRIKTEKQSFVQQSNGDSRTSDSSTYEDAQEERTQLVKQMRPLKVALEKIPLHTVTDSRTKGAIDLNGTYTRPMVCDGTFTNSPPPQDGTFTVNSPMKNVPGAPQCNETFNIPADGGTPSEQQPNATFVIEKNGASSGQRPNARDAMVANSSIMTEDESVIENSPVQVPHLPEQPKPKTTASQRVGPPPPTGPKPKNISTLKKSASSASLVGSKQGAEAKKNKELFNPCVMSPIKSRIEAFEKCATTSTKIGTPQAQIGRIMKTVSTPTISTDVHGLARSAHAKPLASSVYTPNCAAQPALKASSASKVGQMQSRALHHATRSQSRDSSWDRAQGNGTLSAASSTSSLLDEKKKKREEKQRLATAQREAMEREKREHAERLVREKEEKYRKLVHEKQEKIRIDAQKKARKLEEFEKRRLMEEQKALADQKRDELAKQMADQQRIDRELLESVKQTQAKENHEVKLHKQLYQQKLRQQQQQQAAKKKLAAAQAEVFTFEMIDTDDTTDEDVAEDPSAPRKKKRPQTPEWCQKTANFQKHLSLQARIDTKVIDGLFSVQPMTPDLRLLFPSIDAHKLKRNSSAIWRTPPRPSQLP